MNPEDDIYTPCHGITHGPNRISHSLHRTCWCGWVAVQSNRLLQLPDLNTPFRCPLCRTPFDLEPPFALFPPTANISHWAAQDWPYYERQLHNLCGLHGLNAVMGYPAVSAHQLLAFRRSLSLETQVHRTDNWLECLTMEDIRHWPDGHFTVDFLSVWLTTYTGTYLRQVPTDNSIFSPADLQPGDLFTLAHACNCQAFLVIRGHHILALRLFHGQWWLIEPMLPGPQVLSHDNHPANNGNILQLLYLQPLPPHMSHNPPCPFMPILTSGAPSMATPSP
ncbi:MAG: hypothetical protein EOM68_31935, partial [Spirochaetia bacterium]|nr:hypothetical protein [Spirochaetia bacterium]